MSVNSVNYANTAVQTAYDTTAQTTDTSKNKASDSSKETTKYDTYEKGKETTFDRADAQKAIKAAESAKAESMKMLLNSMLQTQYGKYVKAMPSKNLGSYFANLEVDEATRLQAQKDISEDGYWGVNQTAGRILDFAKALAGDDPDKLEEMKKAVEKGFKLAEDMWGGTLPSISQQTHEKVLQGFDEWEKEINSKKTGAAAAVEE